MTKVRNYFKTIFRPATHEPVFRKIGDFVSSNNGRRFDNLKLEELIYIASAAVKTPLNICNSKIKFLLFFLFYEDGMWR